MPSQTLECGYAYLNSSYHTPVFQCGAFMALARFECYLYDAICKREPPPVGECLSADDRPVEEGRICRSAWIQKFQATAAGANRRRSGDSADPVSDAKIHHY